MAKQATAVAATEETAVTETPSVSLTKPQQKAMADMGCSQRIRYLASQGYATKDIPKLTTNAKGGVLRYQHARNVLENDKAKQAKAAQA